MKAKSLDKKFDDGKNISKDLDLSKARRSSINYEINKSITEEQFVDILRRSGLEERRPVDDPDCVAAMVANADLTVTAWSGNLLVGIARSVTDRAYCCYLSDLAVDRRFQKQGIGRELIARTQAELGPRCTLILLSAPAAVDYYPRIGMEKHPQAWVLPRGKNLAGAAKEQCSNQ